MSRIYVAYIGADDSRTLFNIKRRRSEGPSNEVSCELECPVVRCFYIKSTLARVYVARYVGTEGGRLRL